MSSFVSQTSLLIFLVIFTKNYLFIAIPRLLNISQAHGINNLICNAIDSITSPCATSVNRLTSTWLRAWFSSC